MTLLLVMNLGFAWGIAAAGGAAATHNVSRPAGTGPLKTRQ